MCKIFCFAECPATSPLGLGAWAIYFLKDGEGTEAGLGVSLSPALVLSLLPSQAPLPRNVCGRVRARTWENGRLKGGRKFPGYGAMESGLRCESSVSGWGYAPGQGAGRRVQGPGWAEHQEEK